jgi:hypothetical protein
MTTGALIFARNNEQIDYVAMAQWSAKNIERHLGIPTHIVTDDSAPATNARHFTDVGSVTWHNLNRMDAYRLTPWDCTLVLDADYIVASNQLMSLLQVDQDFLAHRWAYDVTGCNNFEGLNSFGANHMPMWWATVMMFRKSNTAQYIFDCMGMIRANWRHYKDLYHIAGPTYRNDYALSIALGIISGHTLQVDHIPFDLASVMPEHALRQLDADYFEIGYTGQDNKPKTMAWHGMDFHAMGKKHLGDIIADTR